MSDISRLTLWAPRTLIEQGDHLNLTVSAFDNHLNEFDADQYSLMKFNIEAEMAGVIKQQGLKAVESSDSNRVFETKGVEPGIYQIVASTFRKSNSIDKKSKSEHLEEIRATAVSEMLRIEVFPLLEVIPSELLITPNMRYTL